MPRRQAAAPAALVAIGRVSRSVTHARENYVETNPGMTGEGLGHIEDVNINRAGKRGPEVGQSKATFPQSGLPARCVTSLQHLQRIDSLSLI